MSGFLSIIIAAAFGIWGYYRRLFPAWAFIFNVLIGVYLAVMLTSPLQDLAGGYVKILGNWANSAFMIGIFGIYLALSQLLSKYYLTDTYCVSFPKWIDFLGGAFFAFIGGYILANFVFFSISSSPLNHVKYVSNYIPDNQGGTLVKTCRFVSSFSFQDSDELSKIITKLATLPEKAKSLVAQESKKDANEPPVVTKKSPPQTVVFDVNDPSERIKYRNDINTDANNVSLAHKDKISNQPDPNQTETPKTVIADNNAVHDSVKENNEPQQVERQPEPTPEPAKPPERSNRLRGNRLKNPLDLESNTENDWN
ncbi:MAG: CvpA family protein [Phycisphaerales bacterium]